ncbi:MAG: hypothetical protein A4E63_02987 [Syntrophorhabdus sp. PtaU1.Bin050]|nr:MAG: hypothetical protein A4E63_02987 [Syntrophorhabdus sp. PtaU1.Bin050]
MEMKLVYKVWLENDDSRAFGEGPYQILRGVESTGSLLGAATLLSMAYSKALHIIASCERSLGFALIHRKMGGISGGGSEVTLEAAKLMKVYEALRADTENTLAKAYAKCFGGSVQVQFYTIVPHKPGRKNLLG